MRRDGATKLGLKVSPDSRAGPVGRGRAAEISPVRRDWIPEVRRDNGTGSVGSGEETIRESVIIQADDSDDDVNLPTGRV